MLAVRTTARPYGIQMAPGEPRQGKTEKEETKGSTNRIAIWMREVGSGDTGSGRLLTFPLSRAYRTL